MPLLRSPGSPALTALFALLGAALGAPEAAAFQPRFHPTLSVSPTPGSIHVDGELDDAGWKGAAVADGFAEVNPGDQIEPPVKSEAWVTFDDANLYVALIAYDDPKAVRVNVTDRDNIFDDDYFGLMLDTYGNQSWGYELFVNPLGIQGDLRLESGGNEDGSFDIIWHSKGRVTGRGYQVEIAIPFSSLRFPDRAEQSWRINFWRDHQRDVRRKYAWAATDRDDPCFMCQWGTLTGIRHVQPGRNLEAIASLIGSQAGALSDRGDPGSDFRNDPVSGAADLSLKYGINSTTTAELAVNPDYSQVESDAGRIDVNSTFALFFPERRPFFQEGSNLFNTWISGVYTRSINDPDVAVKMSGQAGKTQYVYLAARDEATPMIIPHEQRSDFLLLDGSFSNIARVRHSLMEEAYLGALVTDRRLEGGGGGTLVSGDALFRVFRNYRIELQAAASRTQEPWAPEVTGDLDPETFDRDRHTVAFDAETFWGNAYYASIERDARTWNFDFDWWDYGPSFRTDNGFTTRNDYRQASGWSGLFFRPNRGLLVEWEPSLGVGRVWNSENRFKDEWLRPQVWFNLKSQTGFGSQYLISRERFGTEVFPGIRIWSFWLDTKPTEILGGGLSFNTGQGIYRDFDAPELAQQENRSVYVNLKPSSRVELNVDWDYAKMDSRITDENLFEGWILRNRLTLNFTRQLFLRTIVQYNEFNERLDLEPLLTYRINPFTVFFVGSTNQIRHYEPDADNVDVVTESMWRSAERQYFAKLQYLFRI
jgi:hypothetical protein